MRTFCGAGKEGRREASQWYPGSWGGTSPGTCPRVPLTLPLTRRGLRGQPGKPQTTPGPRSQPLAPICEGQPNASDPKGLFGWSVSQFEFPTPGHGFLLTAPVQPVQLELGGGTRGGLLPSQTCPPSPPPSGIRTLQGAGESNSW